MHRILIVEDDQVVANIYRNKLAVEGFQVEVARDGLAGLEMAHRFRPHAAIIDLMLPKMTGVEVIEKLRAEPEFEKLPLVVFSNTYLTNMVQEAWKAGATRCLSKANCSPKQMIELVRGLLSHNGGSGGTAITPRNLTGAPTQGGAHTSTPATASRHVRGADPDAEFQNELRSAFIDTLPATLKVVRTLLQGLIKADNEAARLKQLYDLYRRTHALTGNAAVAGVPQLARISDPLEALLKELYEKPRNISPSTLRTVASAVDCLCLLFDRGLPADKQEKDNQLPNVLVVDDEAISRRAVAYALEKARLRSVNVEDPQLAFELLAQTRFELIFLDIDMPAMTGFELCTKLRGLPAHKKTPVVFVTSLTDFESRASSTMSGGNDFIGKPFLFIELAVKALVHVLRGRLQTAN